MPSLCIHLGQHKTTQAGHLHQLIYNRLTLSFDGPKAPFSAMHAAAWHVVPFPLVTPTSDSDLEALPQDYIKAQPFRASGVGDAVCELCYLGCRLGCGGRLTGV